VWTAISTPFWIAVSRIGVGVVFAHLLVTLLPEARQHIGDGSLSGGTWLGTFDNWDSIYYTSIAQHAYSTATANISYTAFFPGYPLLIAAVHAISFGTLDYVDSAMAVSWLALTGAAIVLYRLVARLFSVRVALIATVLFCWFPASLFYLAPYSEALFALEILVVVALIERKAFLAAAIVAAYASATSPESIALTLALMIAAYLAGKGLQWVAAYGAISITGLVAYMLYLWGRVHHPLEFITVQKFWHRSENLPLVGLFRNITALRHFFVGPGEPPGAALPTYANIKYMWLLDDASLALATILLFALIGMWVVRSRRARATTGADGLLLGTEHSRIPTSFVVVAAVIVLLAACTTIYPYGLSTYASTEGEARFVSIVFPLYVAAALLIRRHAVLIAWAVGGCVALALLYQALFNLGYWVT
jgi:hypothetical protein